MNSANNSLQISHAFLAATGTKIFRYFEDRIPHNGPVLVVSNHRSFMDAPVLMASVKRPIRFACHHYMGQVPVMREIVTGQLGCFPLEAPENRQQGFFQQALKLLQTNQAVGVFPEGTKPMVDFTEPNSLGEFQRGFAHLALRADAGSATVKPVEDLAILPVAIASLAEANSSAVPLRLLSLFDPSEPLFNQNGWHPLVIYHRVGVLIGCPYRITAKERQQYQGKQAKAVVADITGHCQTEIAELLRQGCY
ncbi:lysophospholipid acyltransferase family protein [Aliterella atlantica]|uniref:Glycerol acyltransferase n=1 Tax=Aliterella atlantica CENA595 TaxID=1618023 RepID=A0A0D8ZWX5_9CYAN|nr:lysophospholipid acyltransferase family protein [Aliterella atlantica]KJH72902.1 glycerol acyltransferase [Aliterella atlantica CENA595]